MARRYVHPSRVAESALEREVGAKFSIAPGEVTAAHIRAYAELTAPKATRPGPDGPAAKLDKQPFAASWSAFLNAIRRDDDARAIIHKVMEESRPRNEMGTRIPSGGGFLVPQRLAKTVLAYMTRGVIKQHATQVPMDTLRVGIPTLENISQASGAQGLGGLAFYMAEETAGITPTSPSFSQVVLEARKAAALLQRVPNELLDDATAFTEVFLPQTIALGMEWFIDDMAIGTGTGVGEPQALVNAPGAVTVNRGTANEVLHLDIITCLKNLHPASKASATWLLSEDAFDFLLELYENPSGGSNAGIATAPGTLRFNSVTKTWELLGVPAVVTDHQGVIGARGDVMLVDLALYLWGQRDEMLIEISSKGDGFVVSASNIRIKQRIDGRFWPQSSYTLQNGKVVSPLVVLQ